MDHSPDTNCPNTTCQVDQHWRAVRVAAVVMLIGILLLPGCVRRRLNVRSNPAGALVYVDNQQIGTTPCSVDFTYYGTREIRLIKAGYETLTVNQPIPTPWYQIPPIDFVSENLVPTKIRDNRTVTYDLAPRLEVPKEQLIDRANQLRQETLQFPVQPAAAIGTGSVVTPVPTLAFPNTAAPSTTTTAPFPPPPMPSGATIVPPPQQGPPLVSPPLR